MERLSVQDYNNYMKVVNNNIKDTEHRIRTYNKCKKVSELSYEQWVEFVKGNLKITP